MRVAPLSILAIVLALNVVPATAEDDLPARFACDFKIGSSWSLNDGNFQSKPTAPLSFAISKIDLEAQSAELVTGQGGAPGKLRVVRAINANHYLEVVNEGFLNLTTIYDKDAKSGLYPAVHSRHFGFLGQPDFAQYAGTCKGE